MDAGEIRIDLQVIGGFLNAATSSLKQVFEIIFRISEASRLKTSDLVLRSSRSQKIKKLSAT